MMKSYGLFGLIGFLVLSPLLALPARAEDTPQVFISEINWAGSELSTADEWIELVNLGSNSVDLSHYVLTGTATSGGAIEIAEGTVIEPKSALLIANYALDDLKTSLLVSPNLVTTAISLPNSSLDILLATPTGLVIDNYTDGSTPDFGSTNPVTSIERDLTTLEWRSSMENINLSATSQLGTPGAVSLPVVVNSEPAPEVEQPDETLPVEPVVETPAEPVINPTPIEPEPTVDQPTVEETNTEVAPALVPAIEEETVEVVLEQIEEITPILETEPVSEPTPVTPVEMVESPIIEPTNTSVVQQIAPGEIVLNELVSDPIDGVEWVELRNMTAEDIDLTGSVLVDAGDHITELPHVVLAGDSLLVIENPNGNLNNTTETLSLFDSYGTLLDTLSYGTTEIPAPQDGESLARNSEGAWSITAATRNATNVFMDAVTPESTDPDSGEMTDEQVDDLSLQPNEYEPLPTNTYDTTPIESDSPIGDPGTTSGSVEETDDLGTSATEPVHRIVAIAKSITETGNASSAVRNDSKSTSQVTVTGTVVALPDTFGKQIMYLDGQEIYFYAADWPTLALGDIVQVTGVESTNNGVKRIKISSAEAITTMNHVDIVALPIDGSELATTAHGTLVSISGRVIGKDGNDLSIMTDDGTTITALSNKKTGVTWSDMRSGAIIVSGIVKHTGSGIVVAPRTNDDVHFTPEIVSTTLEMTKAKTSTTPLVGGGLLTGSVGALSTWYLRSRKGLLSWLPF